MRIDPAIQLDETVLSCFVEQPEVNVDGIPFSRRETIQTAFLNCRYFFLPSEGMNGRSSARRRGSGSVARRRGTVAEARRSTLPAGDVVFFVEHEKERGHAMGGDQPGEVHDLVVMRVNDDGSREIVGRSPGLESGDEAELQLSLEPGEYELICSIVEDVRGETANHFELGMHKTITVE